MPYGPGTMKVLGWSRSLRKVRRPLIRFITFLIRCRYEGGAKFPCRIIECLSCLMRVEAKSLADELSSKCVVVFSRGLL